jgi:hypothetical protein
MLFQDLPRPFIVYNQRFTLVSLYRVKVHTHWQKRGWQYFVPLRSSEIRAQKIPLFSVKNKDFAGQSHEIPCATKNDRLTDKKIEL